MWPVVQARVLGLHSPCGQAACILPACHPTCPLAQTSAQEGLKYMFNDKSLVTVWSAPNYCYRCGNVASILSFDENLERVVKYFTETEENSSMMAPRAAVPYFL